MTVYVILSFFTAVKYFQGSIITNLRRFSASIELPLYRVVDYRTTVAVEREHTLHECLGVAPETFK